jgi:signal transduction histidine kinase
MSKSIKTKFTLYLGILLIILLLLFGTSTYIIAKRDASDTTHEILRMLTLDGSSLMQDSYRLDADDMAQILKKRFHIDSIHVTIWIVNKQSQKIIYTSASDSSGLSHFPSPKPLEEINTIEYFDVQHHKVSSILVTQNKVDKVYLQIAIEPLYHHIFLENLLTTLILSSIGIFIFFLISTHLIFKRVFLPIQNMIATVNTIDPQKDPSFLNVENVPLEIKSLVETFNTLLNKLYKSLEKVRNFSGDASHELKTPLTIMRGEAELLLRSKPDHACRQTLQTILDETIYMENVINDLLLLAEFDNHRIQKAFHSCSIKEIISLSMAFTQKLADAKNIKFDIQGLEETSILGNASLLQIMITNLLKNAIHYGFEKSSILIQTETKNNQCIVSITDQGRGIAKDALPHIFDRFYHDNLKNKKDYTSYMGSTGLGLAIVKNICDLHHFSIKIESQINQGSKVIITIPI